MSELACQRVPCPRCAGYIEIPRIRSSLEVEDELLALKAKYERLLAAAKDVIEIVSSVGVYPHVPDAFYESMTKLREEAKE